MSARAVNLGLYVVTFVLIATGVATIGTNHADAWWLYESHRYAGALLCLLLIPKFGIILRAYTRRFRNGTWNEFNTWGGLALTLLLLVSTVGVLVWTLNLVPFWIQIVLFITPLALHWYVAIALVPFFLWHIWARWVTPPKFARMPRELLRIATYSQTGVESNRAWRAGRNWAGCARTGCEPGSVATTHYGVAVGCRIYRE